MVRSVSERPVATRMFDPSLLLQTLLSDQLQSYYGEQYPTSYQCGDCGPAFNFGTNVAGIEKANPYRIKVYRRAANTIRVLGESVDELVRINADLTVYSGIGRAISSAVPLAVVSGMTISRIPTFAQG